MILRDASSDDEEALQRLDVGGPSSPWLDEVSEIVSGLLAWRDDDQRRDLDRRVIVAVEGDEIVAVAAHERIEHERLGPLERDRYLMLVAVRADHRRTGLGRVLTESVVSEMQHEGVSTVRWLVHPQNVASLAFSRSVFPEADETYPPEDRPYVVFMLALVTNEAYFTAKIGVTTTTAKYGRIETHENAGWLLRGRWATTTADEAVTISKRSSRGGGRRCTRRSQ